jgi:hypothetical protein
VCTLESPPALERGLQNLLESLLAESALGWLVLFRVDTRVM